MSITPPALLLFSRHGNRTAIGRQLAKEMLFIIYFYGAPGRQASARNSYSLPHDKRR
jgi:hypothetical protein